MSDDTVIRVEGLWKRYGLPLPEAYYRGRRWLRALRSGQRSAVGGPADDGPWALRDVSFEVKRGETLGIIGRNGAGKSTLLKVLAGVTPPTRGKVEVRGRVFPMIELNAGLHMELTGRENVRLLGAVMGLARHEIEARLPQIEAFCELGEWFDRPVRMYSSGMLARLGFGVAMNVDAQVLLIDEVLAVGDLIFQRSCFDRLEKLRGRGATVIFVSHAIRQIQRICSRVALFEDGITTKIGDPAGIAFQYYRLGHEMTQARLQGEKERALTRPWIGTGEIVIDDVKLTNGSSQETTIFYTDESIDITFSLRIHEPCTALILGAMIATTDFVPVLGSKTTLEALGPNAPSQCRAKCRFEQLPLLPGTYVISATIKTTTNRLVYRSEHIAEFIVAPSPEVGQEDGLVWVASSWSTQVI